MAISKLITNSLTDDTISSAKLNDGAITNAKINASAGIPISKFATTATQPTISTLSISQKDPDSSSNITVTGTNFESIPTVIFVNTTTGARITSATVTYTSSTSITAVFPASQTVGIYKVIVENPTGLSVISTATIINSAAPNWVTSASLGSVEEGDTVNIQLLAYDDDSSAVSSYSLQSGSLPSGVTLSGDSTVGALTGTAPQVSADTAYNFTIRATDDESQTTDQAFSLTVADYNIGNSVMFDDSSNDNLYRTFSSSGSRTTWTLSCWVKKSEIADTQFLIGANSTSNPENNGIYFRGDDAIEIDSNDGGNRYYVITSAKYRDPSAWYHVVCHWNTTDSTASNRFKVYINGEEQTIGGNNYPPQNYEGQINRNVIHRVGGAYNYSNTYVLDGYLAEYHFIDGQALTPSSFGETNSNGVWIPKKYSGTYGTNGFLLEFDDSSDFGTDTSGNGNDFTASNLATTSASQDTPHLNYATLNPLAAFENDGTTYFNGNYSLSEGNLKAASSGNTGNWGHAFSTIGMSAGKWYWEVKTTSISNSTHVGVSQLFTSGYFQNQTTSRNINLVNGSSTGGAGSGAYNLSSFTTNDILMIALDMDNGKVYFGRNGTWGGSGDPATGTNPCFTGLDTTETYFAGFDIAYTGGFHWNFGSPGYSISSGNSDGDGYGNFEYTVPSGYYALNSKNLATYG